MNKQADFIDPRHDQARSVLRLVGPLVLGAGVIFMAVGIGSFFYVFGSGQEPRYFWCGFVGMPLLFVGAVLSQFGFAGAVMRYMAQEGAPVGKDTFNYTVAGTKDSVRDLAAAVGEGLSSGLHAHEVTALECPKCKAVNALSANFCNRCGAALH